MRPTIIDRIIVKLFNLGRKYYAKRFGQYQFSKPIASNDSIYTNQLIHNLLSSDKPCMIGRFGSNEIECTVFTRNRLFYKRDFYNYIRGKSDIWWYPDDIVNKMQFNAGFFTPTVEQLNRFGQEMINAMPLLDVLGSWCKEESYFSDELSNTKSVNLELLNPLWGSASEPWTTALQGKKVLVVHPFVETIERQYHTHRESIHKDSRILPLFSLETIKSVQSITGIKPDGFDTWFDALQYMEEEIDKKEYDICIIGCGAYGFLLAAHCKRMGKKAIHLGGATQLLFGIKGKRWENPNYGFNGVSYKSFFTKDWVRPSQDETPLQSSGIEEGCYW